VCQTVQGRRTRPTSLEVGRSIKCLEFQLSPNQPEKSQSKGEYTIFPSINSRFLGLDVSG